VRTSLRIARIQLPQIVALPASTLTLPLPCRSLATLAAPGRKRSNPPQPIDLDATPAAKPFAQPQPTRTPTPVAGASFAAVSRPGSASAPAAGAIDPLSFRSGDVTEVPADSFILHLNVSPNNTIYNVSDAKGNTKIKFSCGQAGFTGSAKSSAVANQQTAEQLAKKMLAKNIREVTVFLKGIGPGRRASVRGLIKSGIQIRAFIEKTPVPHNGSRKPKKRRL